jgi:hypothetical protein
LLARGASTVVASADADTVKQFLHVDPREVKQMSTRTATGIATIGGFVARSTFSQVSARCAFIGISATFFEVETFERLQIQFRERELAGTATIVVFVARTGDFFAGLAIASKVARSARLRSEQTTNSAAQNESGRIARDFVTRCASHRDFIARSASDNWLTRIAVVLADSAHQIFETFEQVSSFHNTSVACSTTGVNAIRVTRTHRKTSNAH